MNKKFYYQSFIILLFLLLGIFCGLELFNSNIHIFYGESLKDYFADFYNQIRMVYDENVYYSSNYTISGEKALPPLQYILLIPLSKCANFNQIPTLVLNGFSFQIEIGKAIFITNYVFMAISALFFLLLYENLNIQNKFLKFSTIALLIFSAPMFVEYQRGNLVLLTVLATTFFLFYYKSENKILRNCSLISLAFAFALKPIIIFILILLLFEKRYKDILFVSLTTLIISLLCFSFLGGFDSILLYFRNVLIHQEIYKYATSIFTPIFVIFAFISGFFKEEWQRVFSIVLLMLICVPRYYYFLFLFPVIIIFLNKKEFTKIDILFGIMFIILISPIYLIINGVYDFLPARDLCICEIIMIANLVFEKLLPYLQKRFKNDD